MPYFGLQVHIVQRGAVRPLIQMLEATDPQLREMAAFALGRLAQVVEYKDIHFHIIAQKFTTT